MERRDNLLTLLYRHGPRILIVVDSSPPSIFLLESDQSKKLPTGAQDTQSLFDYFESQIKLKRETGIGTPLSLLGWHYSFEELLCSSHVRGMNMDTLLESLI